MIKHVVLSDDKLTFKGGVPTPDPDSQYINLSKSYTWVEANPWTKVETVISYGNNYWVLCGYPGGSVGVPLILSNDDITTSGWTTALLSNSLTRGWEPYAAASNNNIIIIVGAGDFLLYSEQGNTGWTYQILPAPSDLYYCASWGNGRFIIVSDEGPGSIVYYADDSSLPLTWNSATTLTGLYTEAKFINNKFFITDAGSGYVKYSTDGISWTGGTVPQPQGLLSAGIGYCNGRYLVSGSFGASVYTKMNISTDGLNWTYVTTNLFYHIPYRIETIDDRFYCIFEDGTAGNASKIYYSFDGQYWIFDKLMSETWLSSTKTASYIAAAASSYVHYLDIT